MSSKGGHEVSALAYTFGAEKQWVGIDVCQKYLDVYVRPLPFAPKSERLGMNLLVN
jgi:hypothetical protein